MASYPIPTIRDPLLAIPGPLSRQLSKLYSDTKRSYDTVTEPPKVEATPELTSLHRKFRIQKDRLITWGLEWSDTTAAQPGDIDESVGREGLSDVVGSVMSTIKELLAEAEQMRYADQSGTDRPKFGTGVKPDGTAVRDRWQTMDRTRFEDLLRDLTTSIDSLYGLSRSRSKSGHSGRPRDRDLDQPITSSSLEPWTFQDMSTPPRTQEKAPRVSVPPSRIAAGPGSSYLLDRSSFLLGQRAESPLRPPPYETVATPSSSRVMGYMTLPVTSSIPWKRDRNQALCVPVFIEYAPFDPIYSTTGISPPMDRLEKLAETLHRSDEVAADPMLRVPNMVGYFEDTGSHRYGVVYSLPEHVSRSHFESGRPLETAEPFTLLSVLKIDLNISSQVVPNLEDRFRLSYNLATTFLQLHTKAIVHKDVTSNNIVFFPSTPGKTGANQRNLGRELRRPYLCSFDVFSDTDVEISSGNNIYRHPLDSRKDKASRQAYRSSFDIYGLGLILLEIGLWMQLSSFWKPQRYDLFTFKSRLQDIYVKKLGHKCGTTYMRAVESCLSAVERDHAETRVGKTFNMQWSLYCDVVKRLEQCCAIDESEPPDPLPDLTLPQSPPPTTTSPPDTKETEVQSSASGLQSTVPVTPGSSAPDVGTDDPAVIAPAPVAKEEDAPRTEDSPSKSRPKMRIHPVKISSEQLDEWHHKLLPRLQRLVEKTLTNSKETFTIDLMCVGETVQMSRPTIFVTCASVGPVKTVLSRRFKFDKSAFGLKVRAGKLRRSCGKSSKRKKRTLPQRCTAGSDEEDYAVMHPYHQARPLCGASIGAFKDGKHLPAVSYGGVVLVDGDPYGMTVHHLLDGPSDDESDDGESETRDSPTRSSARRPWGGRIEGAEHGITGLPHRDIEEMYTTDFSGDDLSSASEAEGEFEWSDDEGKSDDSESVLSDTGDIQGIPKGEGDRLLITQPAIDDVRGDFFPREEDKDEEHLESHMLGRVYASSGIRRWKKDELTHEIDWALLKVKQDRLQPHNLIQGGRRHCSHGDGNSAIAKNLIHPVDRAPEFNEEEDLYPNEVAGMYDLGNLKVHGLGRTSGLRDGIISPSMSAVRVTGRRTASISWRVFGGFGSTYSNTELRAKQRTPFEHLS